MLDGRMLRRPVVHTLCSFLMVLLPFTLPASMLASEPETDSQPNAESPTEPILGTAIGIETDYGLDIPTYDALRTMRPDGRTLAVEALDIERDSFHFHFERGTLHLLQPVKGRTLGGVFIGQGQMHLRPADPRERYHLAVRTNQADLEVLSESFENAVFLFTDSTWEEIAAKSTAGEGEPDAKALQLFDKHLEKQRKIFHTNFHLRLLIDLLHEKTPGDGVFMAFLKGSDMPHGIAAVDPMGADTLGIGRLGGEDSVLMIPDGDRRGIWYASDQKYEVEAGQSHPPVQWVSEVQYTIDTEVLRNDDLIGTTTMRFQTAMSPLRVLPLVLMPKLRLAEVVYSLTDPEADPAAVPWIEIPFIQEDEDDDPDTAVIFPEPLPQNKDIWLRLKYGGDDILRDVGGENYVVGARQSWFPNVSSWARPSHFRLTYRIPEGNELISVGTQVDEQLVDGQKITTFETERPIRVAGFNYGRFKAYEGGDDALKISVYTSPGTPQIIRNLNSALGGNQSAFNDSPNAPIGGGFVGRISTEGLAQSALIDGVNAARVATAYFGPLPQSHVAITQQAQWSFGQSWPSLIFMPYLAFLSSTHRAQLKEAMGFYLSDASIESLGYHEFAHQWWGHLVGWNSYRDQWLSEGFAEFTAALTVQQVRGWDAYERHWKEARKTILGKGSVSLIPHHEAGPITQGWRVASQRSRSAYSALTYQKGAYVLHMLRMMMWDANNPANPDERFIAMMKDFVEQYRDDAPSTDDFQRIVEKHMIPEMDAVGDGRMNWFFSQWVHGVAIPSLQGKLEVTKSGKGHYLITGSIQQSEVPDNFVTMLPIYLDFGKGDYVKLGTARMIGTASQDVNLTLNLPKKPKGALINARSDVLARD